MQKQRFSKGLRETVRRVGFLSARYGLSPDRIGKRIERMIALMARWDTRPTIPVAGSVVDRHPSVISRLRGADLAIHGYHHRSYAGMTIEEQAADLDGAITAFARHGLVCAGFRAPYLATSSATFRLLRSRRFMYDSSIPEFYLGEGDPIFHRAKALTAKRYGPTLFRQAPTRQGSTLTELPVALPDDEILVDGLGLHAPSALGRILDAMVARARASEGHLILQVHPERFDIVSDALHSVLQKAADEGAWMPTLNDAAEWMMDARRGPGCWPRGGPYAVSVTGDLDALSLGDFAGRMRVA